MDPWFHQNHSVRLGLECLGGMESFLQRTAAWLPPASKPHPATFVQYHHTTKVILADNVNAWLLICRELENSPPDRHRKPNSHINNRHNREPTHNRDRNQRSQRTVVRPAFLGRRSCRPRARVVNFFARDIILRIVEGEAIVVVINGFAGMGYRRSKPTVRFCRAPPVSVRKLAFWRS